MTTPTTTDHEKELLYNDFINLVGNCLEVSGITGKDMLAIPTYKYHINKAVQIVLERHTRAIDRAVARTSWSKVRAIKAIAEISGSNLSEAKDFFDRQQSQSPAGGGEG